MPLPQFNDSGDLPAGVHPASLDDVVARFGPGSKQRQAATDRLIQIHRLAQSTGCVDRLVVFGSYVTDDPEPNDVDVVLVMRNEFRSDTCSEEASILFDHSRTNDELGSSVFWIRPDMLLGESIEQFLAFWQTKRDGHLRGIVEITP
jgi:predicted nucleotidyltransferase